MNHEAVLPSLDASTKFATPTESPPAKIIFSYLD
jgi:hypothetical protein